MGQNPYQFQIVAAGAVRQAGALTFTDAGNQPGGLPDPVTAQANFAPPAGAAGVTITPDDPNATGDNTTGLEIILPQGAAPNFPNIYALIVKDPDTNHECLQIISDGTVKITGQPFSRPLQVTASPTNPGTILALFQDSAGDTVFRLDASGHIGFFGASPAAQPVVPLTTPTVQNVIDALVALGLVAQSD